MRHPADAKELLARRAQRRREAQERQRIRWLTLVAPAVQRCGDVGLLPLAGRPRRGWLDRLTRSGT